MVEASAGAFAEKLSLLLSDASLRDAMGQRARRLVAERYLWDQVVERLETVYASLL